MNKSAIGSTWEDVQKELFTPEEIAESNLRVQLMDEIMKARQDQGLCQN